MKIYFARQLFVFNNSLIPPRRIKADIILFVMKANVCVNIFPRQLALAIYQRIWSRGHHFYGFLSSNIWSGFGSYWAGWIQSQPLWWAPNGSVISKDRSIQNWEPKRSQINMHWEMGELARAHARAQTPSHTRGIQREKSFTSEYKCETKAVCIRAELIYYGRINEFTLSASQS